MASLDVLFAQALSKTQGVERDEWLEEVCAGDAQLLAELRGLIAAHSSAPSFLDRPLVQGPTAEEMEALPSALGHYRILHEIGRGAQGGVYLAEDTKLHRKVALKVLTAIGRLSRSAMLRFRRESELASRLNHPGICAVYDAGSSDGIPFIAMQFVEGETLAEKIARVKKREPFAQKGATAQSLAGLLGQPSADGSPGIRSSGHAARSEILAVVALVEQVARALHAAHEVGVIHRDIKPGNIIVTGDDQPIIVDFGLSRAIAENTETLTRSTDLLGTPAYMSPEQLRPDRGRLDRQTDVYSLGATLFECLTLRRPFAAPTREGIYQQILNEPAPRTRRLNPQLPRDLEVVVATALEKDLTRRYASAEALAEDLRRVRSFEAVQARRMGSWIGVKRWAQRHPVVATSLVGLFVLLLVGLMSTTWYLNRMATERASVFRLRALQSLVDLRREADEVLWPITPASVVEVDARLALYDRWLARAEHLVRGLDKSDPETGAPGHRVQLAALRARSRPLTDDMRERDRRSHPRFGELMAARARLDAERRAQAVREGRATPPDFTLDESMLPAEVDMLRSLAWTLVDPSRTTFGREAEGLALARRFVEHAGDRMRPEALHTLAWALFANGLDEDAIAAGRRAERDAPPSKLTDLRSRIKLLARAISAGRSETGTRRLARLKQQVASLEIAVSERRTWEFDSQDHAWWHAQLTRLVDELEKFMGPEGRIHGRNPRFNWGVRLRRDALAAIARAFEASRFDWKRVIARVAEAPRYDNLRLEPQLGLVPLGPDPDSGLEEFWAVATGDRPQRDPTSRRLVIEVDTGVVMVLVPGGSFLMGAQNEDRDAANFDPRVRPVETPAHQVALAAYLIAKHETTRGQWLHLTGDDPSGPFETSDLEGAAPVDLREAVGNVNWVDCDRTLRGFGLQIPTEAQWEYACRAGTATAWWTGQDRATLKGAANLADAAALRRGAKWPSLERWPGPHMDDGYGAYAPVGSFRANPFGLHDVHGNVFEWCRDFTASYVTAPRPGDGLRGTVIHRSRIVRGGSFLNEAAVARSAFRHYAEPDNARANIGVRCSRDIRSK